MLQTLLYRSRCGCWYKMIALVYVVFACLVLNTLGLTDEESAKIVFDAIDFVYVNDKLAGREKAWFFKHTDCNRDGIVSKDEAMCRGKRINATVADDFVVFLLSADSDNNGLVSDEEYRTYFTSMDTNKSNRVTWKEFYEAWLNAMESQG